ncbi:hypothetical protein V1264_015814 [Littorina saxatilis]|uniref:DDE-1 domain-containing protein n=1 Tax=Littorina saxatilis TaxID=31220 RepID=A0AAN9BKW2_9CAEN
MTGLLFEEWLRSINEKFKKEEKKVCLFIDNCPAHPKVQLSNIKLVFFPPNCTSKLQPCDQGIIANFKHYYRQLVLHKIIVAIDNRTESCVPVADCTELFPFTLLDALKTTRTAWGCVERSTIANCFRHAGFVILEDTELDNGGETEQEESRMEEFVSAFDRVTTLLGVTV